MNEPLPAALAREPTAPLPEAEAPGVPPRSSRLLRDVALFVLVVGALAVPWFLFSENQFRIGLFCRCAALAFVALGVDLIWGYTGLLSLGQAFYFGIGAYLMAYSLKLHEEAAVLSRVLGRVVLPGETAPDFMRYTGLAPTDPSYTEPAALRWIAPLANVWLALALAVLVPMVLAFLFGLVTFHRRIRGVYFALITQALVLAAFLFVDNQQAYTGGRPGINGVAHLRLGGLTFNRFKSPEMVKREAQREWEVLERHKDSNQPDHEEKLREKFVRVCGVPVYRTRSITDLYLLMAGVLVACFLLCAFLVRSRFGKILTAIRDNEPRVLALGYNTGRYKLVAFTVAGGLAGLGGALFVPVVGKMGPSYIDVATSIEVVIFVAVGGRGTLLGALLGTFLVHYGTSYVGEVVKDLRPVIIGLLFVAVVLLMPTGILGLLHSAAGRCKKMLWKLRGPAPA